MLSLSMIVRNEEARLAACLASVKGLADELVVVDTGSTDGTIAVAEAAGARVERIEWPGDFAPARNRAMDFLSGDWVLVLDADEQLRPEVIPSLKALMAQPDVLVINLLRYELGAAMAPYSNVSRLFRRHPGIRWSKPYHSMIDDSVQVLLEQETHWRIADCREPAILHDGYRPELLAGTDKAERLRQAMQSELERHPGDPYASAKLGGLLISDGQLQEAVALLRRALDQDSMQDGERYELLLHLALAVTPSEPGEAIALYRKALEISLDTRITLGARLNLAARLMEQGDLEEAINLTRIATQRAPEVALGWYNLGLMHRRRGDISAALQAYEQALQLDPDNAACHQNHAVALLMGGDIEGARQGFRNAIAQLDHQGRTDEAQNLRQTAGQIVKLDVEPNA
ncbi:glycosyltransferase [Synechococcus sp. CC9616]|uniref:glycosyltransferase n=1 Tax=Synechococcus sp. CC9616 TaxID=110663 RepID=UPI00048B62FD|nr:glycosyltransferase [Synechococcus sp. CC9616]